MAPAAVAAAAAARPPSSEDAGAAPCSIVQQLSALDCWQPSIAAEVNVIPAGTFGWDAEGEARRFGRTVFECCVQPAWHLSQCWNDIRTQERCCGCLEEFLLTINDHRVTRGFMETLKFDRETWVKVDAKMRWLQAVMRTRVPNVSTRLQEIFGATFRSEGHNLRVIGQANIVDHPESEDTAAFVCQVYLEQRKRLDFVNEPSGGRAVNVFEKSRRVPHAPVFDLFPPVQGPPREGHILDFLGVSTSEKHFCATRILAGHQPARVLECLGHKAAGGWLRQPPLVDEELLEWLDVLGAAASAAQRGGGFAVAEIGSLPHALWVVRGAVAFARLAQPGDPCDLLALDAHAIGTGAVARGHLADNLPEGRCRLVTSDSFLHGLPSPTAAGGAPSGPIMPGERGRPLLADVLDAAEPRAAAWDLVDVDVDGFELNILRYELPDLARRVRRLHVQTHTRASHRELVGRLRAAAWLVLVDVPPVAVSRFGPYGRIITMDGHFSAVSPSAAGYGYGFSWDAPLAAEALDRVGDRAPPRPVSGV